MAYEKIMAPAGEKLAALMGLGQYLEYAKNLQVVMVLVGLSCFMSTLALLLLARSHYKLMSQIGISRLGPDSGKTSQPPP